MNYLEQEIKDTAPKNVYDQGLHMAYLWYGPMVKQN